LFQSSNIHVLPNFIVPRIIDPLYVDLAGPLPPPPPLLPLLLLLLLLRSGVAVVTPAKHLPGAHSQEVHNRPAVSLGRSVSSQ